jgi:glycosyltransferase involved in cell wall biosynthesis
MSVVVPTYGRGASISVPIRSILASNHPSFELIVVDQNDDDATRQSAAPFLSDPRLRYIHDPTFRGASRARNAGLTHARAPIVAFTDDDCEVPPDWLSAITATFANPENERVLLWFCNVAAGPHDTSAGYIPVYARSGSVLMRTIEDRVQGRGIGAGMAMHREFALAIGGMDPQLGPGSRFQCGEDFDLATRALLLGYHVYETDAVTVVHHGFRTWKQGRALAKRDWFGIGAAYSKPVRVGYGREIRAALLNEIVVGMVTPFRDDLRRGRRPRGVGRAIHFCRGFAAGVRAPVDRRTIRFVETATDGHGPDGVEPSGASRRLNQTP